MIISSSNRIIKHSDASGEYIIEQYIPPLESAAGRKAVPKKASFPHYGKDGKKKLEMSRAFDAVPSEEKQIRLQGEEDGEEISSSEHLTEEFLKKQQEADHILEEARKEAEWICMEARARVEKELKAAHEEGFQEGYNAGYLEGRKKAEKDCQEEFQNALAAFQMDMRQALSSVERAKENCLHTYLDELKDCAVAVGEKVIHISLKSSGEVIKQMIISATEKRKKTAWVKIYIDKCDYDMMMEADADILDELSHLSDNIKFIVMDKEDRGNCIIEMPEEIVDVSVNTQIENIKDILENVRL
ncbi:FliH/SctL family protein [Lachnospiraceae bacterium 62-35]